MNNSQPVGTLDVALAHASALLGKDPALAGEQAREILKIVPGHPLARLVLGAAQRISGQTAAAMAVLEPLAREQPRSAPAQLELAIALGEGGRTRDAVVVLRRAVQLNPNSPDAWRLLADHLDALSDAESADHARARYLQCATKDKRLMEAAAALVANNLPVADARLRAHLESFPTDVAALRMLAEVAARLRRYADAQGFLERCLELAPSFDAARHNYAVVLNRQSKAAEALSQVQRLLAKEPRNPAYRNLKAAVLAQLGDFAESIGVYEAVLRDFPRQPKVWMSYGHALKTARRQNESIAAYRRALAMEPTLGEAYWSLANLKTFRFSDSDILAMREALQHPDLSDEDRLHFEFSLAKALEDGRSYEQSFLHYAEGNALRRRLHPYAADDNTRFVSRCKAQYTPAFFAARAGMGAAAADPVFIVGLPRAGSTLLEQILASHSLVEGTMELPDIPQIARELAGRDERVSEARFFDAVAALTADELQGLGERYLRTTRVHRKTDAPFFIDKMPNNCLYVGLIHLILPNAKIIDARRHPLGCCFSAFKQHFARGQNFTYGLEDIGRYYNDYVDLMAHVDTVLPGRVHRVFYESIIEDTEAEVRRLLDHCALPFEARCLRFYENERPVRTASSEQVRQPIYREGVHQWKHFEPWLDPLKRALDPAHIDS
ncbi:MAG: sulfotransferase family protein [Gammaproteobacteria bacterium]|nr:sulfotransferase family protein [Gammaproteobacteria bacterium]